MSDRWRAVGGIGGPVAFVAAWAVLGHVRAGYSPVHDPISRLAAVDAPTRHAMTAGFVAFAAGVGAYAPALRRSLPGGAGVAAAVTAAASVGVAALPLGGPAGDGAHAAAAGLAYGALAATPLLGAVTLHRQGRSTAAAWSVVTGALVAAALGATAVLPSGVGLAQRVGLTVGDAWIVASAGALLARRPPGRR